MDLPPNWRAAKDSDGKEYYFNELTGETSWQVPAQELESRPAEPIPAKVDLSAADDGEFAPSTAPANDMIAVSMPSYGGPQDGNGGVRPRPGSLSAKYEELGAIIGEVVLPRLLIVTVCSLIVFVQSAIALSRPTGIPPAGDPYPAGPKKYGISVGVISFAFCAMLLMLARFKPAVFTDFTVPKVPGNLTIMQAFAIWVAVACSMLMLGALIDRVGTAFQSMSNSPIHADGNAKSLIALTVSSAVVMFASIEFVGQGEGEAIFSLVVGIFSMLFTLLIFYLADRKKIGMRPQQAAASLLLALWCAEISVTTFYRPFNVTGNGFFGSWLALCCSAAFTYQCFVGGDGITHFGRALTRSLSFHPMTDMTAQSNLAMTASDEGVVVPGQMVTGQQVMPSMAPITPTANVA